MSKKTKKKQKPVVIISDIDDANKAFATLQEEMKKYLTEVYIEKGFTENQIESSSKEIAEVFKEVYKDGGKDVDMEKLHKDIASILIRNTIGYERLLTDKDIEEYVSNKDAKYTREDLLTLGVSKKDVRNGINVMVEKLFNDAGIIKEKVVNGLFKAIRDNWGSEDMELIIQKELLKCGNESHEILKDKRIEAYYTIIPDIDLELILRFAKGAEEAELTEEKSELEKEINAQIEEARSILRRINPELESKVNIGVVPPKIPTPVSTGVRNVTESSKVYGIGLSEGLRKIHAKHFGGI